MPMRKTGNKRTKVKRSMIHPLLKNTNTKKQSLYHPRSKSNYPNKTAANIDPSFLLPTRSQEKMPQQTDSKHGTTRRKSKNKRKNNPEYRNTSTSHMKT